jgi:lipopolysaccharide biosynthesis regulator YciM
MKNRIWILCALIVLVSCKEEAPDKITNVTNVKDYQQYLDNDESDMVDRLKKEVAEMKTEVSGDSTRIVVNGRISSKLNQLFDLTGDVDYLNESVRLRESVTRNTYIFPEKSKHALAQAYIKQHRFKKADSLLDSFTQEYSGSESQLVQFDIAMELGEYKKAEVLLDSLRSPNDYSYLIRAAKWNDHIGQLGTTITLMERAIKLANQSGSKSLQLWSYSNIADYYGHHGDIEKSYQHYLKTLEKDPMNTYALKGIAWIAYSNDGDVEEARTILKRISGRHPTPDYLLELAELSEYEGNKDAARALKADFMKRVDKPEYRGMYNTYKISEYIDAGKTQEAVDLARIEVQNRSTPETYDLLGYALLLNGEDKAALENQQEYVLGKTFEPKAQFHTALIYKANGMEEEVAALKNELLMTEYEMGPVAFKKITAL